MTGKKLLPCPFCGHAKIGVGWPDQDGKISEVGCLNCPANMKRDPLWSTWEGDDDFIYRAWNKREETKGGE